MGHTLSFPFPLITFVTFSPLVCKAIGVAVEQKEALRWQLEAAKMRFEAWRTQQANDRNIERLTK